VPTIPLYDLKGDNMKFDRETQTLIATRDFDHGILVGLIDKPIDTTDLADEAIDHLVEVAEVARVENIVPKVAKVALEKSPRKPKTSSKPIAVVKSAVAGGFEADKAQNEG
jgi:hypothetical protein